MSLTDRIRDFRVRRVWRSSIDPAAANIRRRGVDVMSTPSEDAESWYSDASSEPHFVDIDDIESALREMWDRQGLPELASVSGDIAQLAKLFRHSGSGQASVSSEVYAMS